MASHGPDELEREPLLPKPKPQGHAAGLGAFTKRLLSKEPVEDAMTYHTQELAQWRSLFTLSSSTVWRSRSLWLIAGRLWFLSCVIAVIVAATGQSPTVWNAGKFTAISDFLRVFVSLLLGFFMAASVTRWWACVEAFIGLCGTVRKLQMMLLACDAPEDEVGTVLRYGLLSAKILSLELHVQALPRQDQEAATVKEWQAMQGDVHKHSLYSKLLPQEADILHEISDPAGTLWIWIGKFLGSLAGRGHIRALAGPIYARCMVLSSEGLDKILRVRSCISVQAPYVYVHMLASLVHISNFSSAVSFGLTFGTALSKYLVISRMHASIKRVTEEEAAKDTQELLVALVFGALGPLVHQALLEVSVAIAQPFSNSKALVPTDGMLEKLQEDLQDGWSAATFHTSSHVVHVEAEFEAEIPDGEDHDD